ncbi:MAG: glycoside hydrolase family 99-like domain-containing protein, partial [Pseudomonadales bacterium]|nr:glycoside hydrolase family 99-like domain-containing protein [Pseudomonadales bacterium]
GQKHSDDDHCHFIRSLFPHFQNTHYIRVDGRPLLLIYRIDIIPEVTRAVQLWREECALAGIEDPYLVAVQSFGTTDPTPYGFDAAVEFPPHDTPLMEWNLNSAYRDRLLNPNFTGNIIDIRRVSERALRQAAPAYPRFRCLMPRWDNTARRQDNSLIFVNSTPAHYEDWLARTLAYTRQHLGGDERLLFINAWNEWGEGCHLEPDQDYGHAYLDATRRALAGQNIEATPAPQTTSAAFPLPEPIAPEPIVSEPSPPSSPQPAASSHSAIRQSLSRSLQTLYRRVPLARTTKVALAHWLFSTFPGPLKNTSAYQRWLQLKQAAQPPSGLSPPAKVSIAPIINATPERAAQIQMPQVAQPCVSIIVPVYGKVDYSLHCLRSIQDCASRTPFEVIVIDDCSPDGSVELLAQVRGIRVLRNDENLGFLRTCNKAAQAARGDYLLFLNNDTQVLPGWLDELYSVFATTQGVGLVGSKLLFADDSLQEAGGIIWNDASGMNYGRGDDPDRPEYNYLRDVDYCSGASIMVPRALFEELGGFDLRFTPAYYEDTDLAFAVRQRGLRVLYQPFSRVLHFEGVTSGTDLTQGVKAYQVVNQTKFLAKWREVLATHGTAADAIALRRERKVQRRVLVMDWATPTPDKDSGSIDTVNYLRMLQTLGFKVVFCPNNLLFAGHYTENLQRIGIECLYQPQVPSLREHLKQHGNEYDLVMLFRVHEAAQHIAAVRRLCPQAKVIFNTVDLHFVRERRQAEVEKSATLLAQAERTKALEHSVMQQSHATIVISDTERTLLQHEWPEINTAAIPYAREVQGCAATFAQRRDLVFIGGFLFSPNVDAMNWFLAEIWPLVRAALPTVRLMIVGAGLLDETIKIWRYHPGVDVVGYVEQITPIFERARLSIAPLRFGAGIKGKVGTSLSHGVPCVATPLAAEGMGLVDHESIMLGTDPATFAAAIVEAYQNEVLWNKLSSNGLALFEEHYSFKRGLERLKALIDDLLSPQ